MVNEMTKIKVYTYAYPEDRDRWCGHPVICYTRHSNPSSVGNMKVYEVEAKNGTEAKKIAYRLRCIDEGFIKSS